MRPITDVLRDIRKGKAVDQATALLAEVVQAVEETQKPGEVTITLKVKPDADNGVLKLTVMVKSKRPEADIGDAVFFSTADGDLVRSDPSQKEMFTDTAAAHAVAVAR